MVDLVTQRVHSDDGTWVICPIAMEVPARVDDGYVSAAGLAQPPGQEHLLTQQVAPSQLINEPLLTVEEEVLAALVVVAHVEEVAGVVFRDGLRVFLREVESIGDAAKQQVVGLALHLAHSIDLAGLIEAALEAVELVKEPVAILEAIPGKLQVEVGELLGFSVSNKTPVETAGVSRPGDLGLDPLEPEGGGRFSEFEIGLYGFRDDDRVHGDPGAGVQDSGSLGAERSHGRSRGMAAGQDRDMVVAAVVRGERTHDGHPVGSLRHLGEGATEPDTRQVGLDLPGAAADVGGDVKLRVEGLDLRRTALQEEEDD